MAVRTPSGRPRPRARGRKGARLTWRGIAIAALHLAVLWSFAVAQPLLDLLGDAPEFFVARENTRGDIIVLALTLTLVPPLVLAAVEALLWRTSPPARRTLHLVLVGLLTAAFALQLLEDVTGGGAAILIPLAAAAGALAALAYARSRAVPQLLTFLSPVPLVVLFVFLVVSPVSKLVLPGGEVETARAAIKRDAPIVMIVFDELTGVALQGPDGRIDAARYPNFARLAGDGTWYRNATTVADYTGRAVPALLSGNVPHQGAAPIASDYPRNLFTLLGGKYSFEVAEPMTDLCPASLCPSEAAGGVSAGTRLRELAEDLSVVSLHLLLPDDLADDLPPVDSSFGDFRELAGGQGVGGGTPSAAAQGRAFAALVALGERESDFREFSAGLARSPARAHLSFLHVPLPHTPFHFLPSGQRYPDAFGETPGLDESVWTRNRWQTRQAFQRYLLQVSYADRLLGEAMAKLRASGRYDRSLIVVAADHGIAFVPGQPYRTATRGNIAEVASIPLLIKAPGQDRGRVNEANVQTTDVLPTIAEELGIELPWDLDGRPAGRRSAAGRVFLQPEGGADVSLPFREFLRRRDARVRRMIADFGATPAGLYGGGPHPELVGRTVSGLAPVPAAGRFELDGSGLLAAVDPRGPVVPAFISGRLFDVSPGARLAVAVNGRVAATTVSFADGDTRRFAAIVSTRAFARGQNTVEVLAVPADGGRTAQLRGSTGGYRLVRAGGRAAIADSSGRRFPVVPAAVAGAVEDLSIAGADVRVSGWAGSTDPPRAADRVLLFVAGRFASATRPALPRPDLERRHGRGLARAGFELGGGIQGGAGADRSDVRVFALSGGRASELPAPRGP